jgi:hypothetical protein
VPREGAPRDSSEIRGISNDRSELSTTPTNQESPDAPGSPTDNAEAPYMKAYDQPAALPHFKLFLDFVDKYLGDKVALYDRLRNGKEQQIAFENIWMLFDQGDTIYCPLRSNPAEEYGRGRDKPAHKSVTRYTPQAYRVVATDGGMPYKTALALTTSAKANDGLTTTTFSATVAISGGSAGEEDVSETMRETASITRKIRSAYEDFVVYCFYVDFDGVKYGKVRDLFVFRPFEREMDIRGLQAYPMAYALSSDLSTRGQRFLKATKVSHLQYEGLTLGPLREDVSGTVIILIMTFLLIL